MKVVLQMPDGSEETRDVAALGLELDGWSLAIRPEAEPLRIHLHVPGSEKSFCSFVVHHRCANTMTVELRPSSTDAQGLELQHAPNQA